MILLWYGFFYMCMPIYTKCKLCKYIHFTGPTEAKCKRFLNINERYYLNEKPNEFCELDLYTDVEIARKRDDLCNNASYYVRRIH